MIIELNELLGVVEDLYSILGMNNSQIQKQYGVLPLSIVFGGPEDCRIYFLGAFCVWDAQLDNVIEEEPLERVPLAPILLNRIRKINSHIQELLSGLSG